MNNICSDTVGLQAVKRAGICTDNKAGRSDTEEPDIRFPAIAVAGPIHGMALRYRYKRLSSSRVHQLLSHIQCGLGSVHVPHSIDRYESARIRITTTSQHHLSTLNSLARDPSRGH